MRNSRPWGGKHIVVCNGLRHVKFMTIVGAKVWSSLKGNRRLVQERSAFLDHMTQHGFGFLEGTKWTKRTSQEEMIGEIAYLPEDKIRSKEPPGRADTIIQEAIVEGEGVGLGWYVCPHIREPVYKYHEAVRFKCKFSKKETLETRVSTGMVALGSQATSAPPQGRMLLTTWFCFANVSRVITCTTNN